MLRKIFYLFCLIFVVTLFGSTETFAQSKGKKRQMRSMSRKIAKYKGIEYKFGKKKQYNNLTLNLSAMNYFGDITPTSSFSSTSIRFTRPQFGLSYSRRLGAQYSLRGSYSWGRIAGDDFVVADANDKNARFRYARNLHFRNDIHELAVTGVFDFLGNNGNYLRRVSFTPYVFGGVAVFYHNPKALGRDSTDYHGKWTALQPLRTEGKIYSRVQLSLPVGVGVRTRLSDNLDLSFEIGYRFAFTDYLDDVSGTYADPNSLKPDAVPFANRSKEGRAEYAKKVRTPESHSSITNIPGYTAIGAQRGSGNKDIYIVSGFHLTYVFIGNGIFSGRRNAKFR